MKYDERKQSAVARAYDQSDEGVRDTGIVSAESGVVAESVIASARKSGIYVHESAPLVALLMQLNMDTKIPRQLYTALAQLLAWLHEQEHHAQEASRLGREHDTPFPSREKGGR